MIVTTTSEIAGQTIVEYKGIVGGDAYELFAGGFGISSVKANFESKMASAKHDALNKLIYCAQQIGANAVVGLSFHFTHHPGACLCVSMIGTAVVVA